MTADTPPPDGGSKSDWRRWARPIRDISAAAHSAAVVRELSDFLGARALSILTYRAMPTEVDPRRIELVSSHHRFVLTHTPEPDAADPMTLTLHPAESPLERHRFGFDQPEADAPVVGDAEIDLVLVPGLAFDRAGNRLGHGQGYFDRLLSRLRNDAVLVGVTIDELVVERLPADSRDVPVGYLATQSGVRRARRES